MSESVVLIAKGDLEWVKFLVPIVAFVIYVLNQLLSGAGKTAKKPMQQPQQRPPRNRPPQGRQDVNDEVRDFLQRASEGKRDMRSQSQEPSRAARRLQKQSLEVVDAEAIDEPPTGERVRSHVAQHLNTREFEQRAAQMAQAERTSELALQSHMHKTSDHQLGTLAPAATADPPRAQDDEQVGDSGAPSTAQNFVELLRNPTQVRQAIIMNEILRRPEDRW